LSELDRVVSAACGSWEQSFSAFAERHDIRSAPFLTVTDWETAALIAEHLAPRIQDKIVVEIGGGTGLLSLAMGMLARRVYCIEGNPVWAATFTQVLLERKQRHVSYLFGAADQFVGAIRADVAVVCTHSDVCGMQRIGRQFAPEVIDV
jgi:predicted RNA methylase